MRIENNVTFIIGTEAQIRLKLKDLDRQRRDMMAALVARKRKLQEPTATLPMENK